MGGDQRAHWVRSIFTRLQWVPASGACGRRLDQLVRLVEFSGLLMLTIAVRLTYELAPLLEYEKACDSCYQPPKCYEEEHEEGSAAVRATWFNGQHGRHCGERDLKDPKRRADEYVSQMVPDSPCSIGHDADDKKYQGH